MKHLLLLALLCPLLLAAQKNKAHRFQNDTLYTSSGFKIYPGQTLRIGKRANDFIGFRYISKISTLFSSLENNSVVVQELSHYGYSPTGSSEIHVKGSIVYRDGSKGLISFTLAFELAMGSRLPGTTSELILPKEYLITKEQALASHIPILEDDTLHTTSGFKIYKGQSLQFGTATGTNDRFRYVNIVNSLPHSALENKQILVWEVKNLTFSALGNAYADITGTVVLNNKRSKEVEIHLSFDYAIEDIPGIPSELVVPAEYKGRLKRNAEAELARIESLYRGKIITKEELEAATRKLSAQ